MRRHAVATLILGALLATDARAQAPREPRPFAAPVELKPAKSFDGRAMVRHKGGAPQQVALRIRNWIIPNDQRIAKFPEQGLLVIQVRAGSLTTIIDGKRQQRGPDEIWSVPPGASMAIETGEDSVILQVVALDEAHEAQQSR
jgi:quercetin dioxygenase-like cupin family protein